MARSRGRCRRGARLIGQVPHGHWKTTTFVAGLRHDGITAPFVIDRPMNGVIFRTYVERVLAPTLRPGDIVILDNLGSHKGSEARRLIEARGAQTSTPSNSPSQSSRPCCERPPRARSTTSGRASATFSTATLPTNAQTTSDMPAMRKTKRITL
jgi:hypothetical protein